MKAERRDSTDLSRSHRTMDTQQHSSSNYLGQSSSAASIAMMVKMNMSYLDENEYNATLRERIMTGNNEHSSLTPSSSSSSSFESAAASLLDPSNLTYHPWLSLVILVVAVLMSLTTIIGNVLVITAFIIEKSLRKYSNYFILNLSIADLLIGILIPPYAPFLLLKRTWRIGRAACTFWLVLDYVVGSASVLCIVVISLDRLILSLYSFNGFKSHKFNNKDNILLQSKLSY